jgi:hypothetical protein
MRVRIVMSSCGTRPPYFFAPPHIAVFMRCITNWSACSATAKPNQAVGRVAVGQVGPAVAAGRVDEPGRRDRRVVGYSPKKPASTDWSSSGDPLIHWTNSVWWR